MFASGRVSVLGVFASLGFSVATPGLGGLDVEDDDVGRVEVSVAVGGDRGVNGETVVSRKSRTKEIFSTRMVRYSSTSHISCASSSSSVIPFTIFVSSSLSIVCFCCNCSSAVERAILCTLVMGSVESVISVILLYILVI